MNCPKCCQPILIGPGGCACTQAARHKRQMEEAGKRGEELAARLKKEMEKPKRAIPKIPKGIDFACKALDEIISQACDFHVDLIQASMEVARNLGAEKVKREHVEKAVKNLRRDL